MWIDRVGQKPNSDEPAVIKRALARQRYKDTSLVLVGLGLIALFIAITLSFLANVTELDQMKWLLSTLFAILEMWFIEPLIFSLIWQWTAFAMTKHRHVLAKAAGVP